MPALLPSAIQLPEYNALALAPVVLVAIGALVCVILEAFLPRRLRHQVELSVSVVALVAAFLVLALRESEMLGLTMAGSVVVDGPTVVIQMLLLVLSLLALIIMSERFGGRVADAFTPSGSAVPGSPMEGIAERSGTTTEVFPLTLFSVSGMMLFPASGDLLTMFIALELLSLPLYVLTALGRRRRLLSQEAALKYFLLGSFSSAFFLFGAAMLYGFSGSVRFGVIAESIATVNGMDPLLWLGSMLVLVGLLFKIGAVPFHSWIPDVYQGAPTPVTGFMAAGTKIAAFGALLRVGYTGIDAARWEWQPVLWIVAGLTMIVGSLLAVTQTDIKRMLAYSSIAHAGFIMVGFIAFHVVAVGSVIFYLTAYGFTTIAAFGLVMLVRATEDQSEATSLAQWEGLGRRAPLVAGAFSFLLMAFAGIPLTSGFTAKFAVFGAAIASAGVPGVVLAVIGVLCSAITAYVYFRVIWLMYFSAPDGEAVTVFTPSVATVSAIALGVVVTFALGVFPSPLLDLASSSSLFLR